jgi:oxalate decarboxylase
MKNENEGAAALSECFSRRNFLGVGSAALATAAFSALSAHAQERDDTRKAEHDHASSNPGQENKPLLDENPDSNTPPPTDHGDIGPIWYSFDLVKKRIEEGGWTHQVTQRELPTSTDLAGVNMRLTAGSIRELHWHTADEWAIMLYGNARVTVMDPETCSSTMSPKETCGTFPRDFRIRSRDSVLMVASFCWSSTRACSQRTIPS